jgi:carbonic anhydrase/acetyltransferase-like protein (isoleucine patch superfamily)
VLVSNPELLDDFIPIAEGMRHRSAWIDPRARVVGPVLIGPNARIFDGAVVVAPAIIGAGSQVCHDATVSRSILWNGCVISEGATVDRALLADHSVVQKGENFKAAMRLPDTDRGRWVSISSPWRTRREERTTSQPDREVPLPGQEAPIAHFDSRAIPEKRPSLDRSIAAAL